MRFPAVVLNFKAYPESGGENALKLSLAAKRLADESNKSVVVCPPQIDCGAVASRFASSPHFSVFGQHVDFYPQGAFTGSISAEALVAAGCKGSLLNHSEKKIGLDAVGKTIARAREAGLYLIVCADSVEDAKKIAAFHPPCIAVEPPELIGSGISVSTAKPEIVTHSVREIRKIDGKIAVLVGAGVSNAADVKKSIELGAQGVLLASAFVKSKNPAKLLEGMLAEL
ncbi:MAG: triose-phosphate isomerase [Candidatus Micrarchaeota archaeon]